MSPMQAKRRSKRRRKKAAKSHNRAAVALLWRRLDGRMTEAEADEMLMARWGSLLRRLGRWPA